jgi:flagellar motor switch protein FliM
MAQVLSQDEVDALLQGIASEQVPAGEPSRGGETSGAIAEAPNSRNEVKLYDFTRSELSSRGRLPGLEVIFNNFARRLQSMFASQLGKSVDANFEMMEVVSYENLIQSFPVPASIHAVRLEPLRGVGIIVVEARLAFAMIELFFGGSGNKEAKPEGRDFTPIESRFLGKFVEKMLRGMEEAWQSVIQLTGRYMRSEMNPYLLNAAGMGDPMILAKYTVGMSPINGTILFSIPLAAIEQLREQLRSSLPVGSDTENTGLAARLRKPLMEVDLDIQAVVDVVHMKVGEIMGLRPGDIIQLNAQGMDQIELWIEGKRKFVGKGAQRNGNKVFIASRPDY